MKQICVTCGCFDISKTGELFCKKKGRIQIHLPAGHISINELWCKEWTDKEEQKIIDKGW